MPRSGSTASICCLATGEDIRKLPLSMRKTNLAQLLARRVDGINLAPFEQC